MIFSKKSLLIPKNRESQLNVIASYIQIYTATLVTYIALSTTILPDGSESVGSTCVRVAIEFLSESSVFLYPNIVNM